MSIGMTFDQYWYGDIRITRLFIEADKIRQERMNDEAWLQGMYFFHAMSIALHNSNRAKASDPIAEYPAKPYEISKRKETKQEREDREENERLQAKLYMQQMMRAGKNWGGT